MRARRKEQQWRRMMVPLPGKRAAQKGCWMKALTPTVQPARCSPWCVLVPACDVADA